MSFHKTIDNGNIVMRNIQIDLFLFLFDGIIHVAKTLYKLTNLLQLLRILEYQLHVE